MSKDAVDLLQLDHGYDRMPSSRNVDFNCSTVNNYWSEVLSTTDNKFPRHIVNL